MGRANRRKKIRTIMRRAKEKRLEEKKRIEDPETCVGQARCSIERLKQFEVNRRVAREMTAEEVVGGSACSNSFSTILVSVGLVLRSISTTIWLCAESHSLFTDTLCVEHFFHHGRHVLDLKRLLECAARRFIVPNRAKISLCHNASNVRSKLASNVPYRPVLLISSDHEDSVAVVRLSFSGTNP